VLRGHVSRYYGWREQTRSPVRRREGPGISAVVIVSFGEEWLIDDERFTSFAAGLHDRQVTTEHAGRSYGIQIDLAPHAAYALFGVPMSELARRTVPLDDVLGDRFLAERLHDAGGWQARFGLLDELLSQRLAEAPRWSHGITYAWRRLRETDGRIAVRTLAEELGWSRRRLAQRFRAEVGLPPKAVAQLLRFERARALAVTAQHPDWARIAVDAGYYDQSHLINDFRRVTGRTPVTFFQDTVAARA
jgi:AraC-like DNA-binding protein